MLPSYKCFSRKLSRSLISSPVYKSGGCQTLRRWTKAIEDFAFLATNGPFWMLRKVTIAFVDFIFFFLHINFLFSHFSFLLQLWMMKQGPHKQSMPKWTPHLARKKGKTYVMGIRAIILNARSVDQRWGKCQRGCHWSDEHWKRCHNWSRYWKRFFECN